jgi:hypothetical protein
MKIYLLALLSLLTFGFPCFGDEGKYPIGELHFRYTADGAGLPSVGMLGESKVYLSGGPEYYRAPGKNESTIAVRLDSLAGMNPAPSFSAGAVLEMSKAILDVFDRQNIMDVVVEVDPRDIDPYGVDQRRRSDDSLVFLITAFRAGDVGTTASALDLLDKEPPKSSKYLNIAPNSPVLSSEVGKRRDRIDNYVYFLNRFPGHRADVILPASGRGKYIDADYVINEEKPWRIYFNAANSGSRRGQRWIERVGVSHDRLFGYDLMGSLDYATNDFNQFNYLRGYLEGDLSESMETRWFLAANWNEFSSTEFSLPDGAFTGLQEGLTLGFRTLCYQLDDLFLDFTGSANWRYVKAQNVNASSSTCFVSPRVGLSVERERVDSTIRGLFSLELNLSSLANTEAKDLQNLGRLNPDKDWWISKMNLDLNWFLDGTTNSPLEQHHEMGLYTEIQYAFGKRLVPQLERSLGGHDTVRGHPQAMVSAPNALLARGEYRYHHSCEDSKLRFVMRAFLDAGRTMFTDSVTGEKSQTLVGTGFGGDIIWNRYISFRSDLGFALKEVTSPNVEVGDVYLHLTMTATY